MREQQSNEVVYSVRVKQRCVSSICSLNSRVRKFENCASLPYTNISTGFMHVKIIFGIGVYMGAMVNRGPIFIKFGAKSDTCTRLLFTKFY